MKLFIQLGISDSKNLAVKKLSGDVLAKAWGKAMGTDRKQFDMFFDKMLDGFAYHKIVVDKAGKPVDYVFLDVNHAFEKMTGLKREHIIGKKVTEVLPGVEKDPADWIGIYGRVALTGVPVQFENYTKVLCKWFKVSAYCPEKYYFVALFEDITERKTTEEKYRRLFEEAMDAIFLADAETGILVDCNNAALKMVGREKSEIVGQPQRFLHPQEEANGNLGRSFKQHLTERDGSVIENKVVTKNGELIDVAIKANLIDFGGKKILQGIFRDITERKKTEEALSKLNEDLEERVRKRTEQVSSERQRLYKVLETLPAYVVLLDKDYRVPFANKVFRERFGESHGRRCL
jgi:PAS domain S-box-containing protein